jgi:hypothetical protein
VRDSYGTSGQVETPSGAKRQEAHRTPRGKRATWSGNQLLTKASLYTNTKCLKNKIKKHALYRREHAFIFVFIFFCYGCGYARMSGYLEYLNLHLSMNCCFLIQIGFPHVTVIETVLVIAADFDLSETD